MYGLRVDSLLTMLSCLISFYAHFMHSYCLGSIN